MTTEAIAASFDNGMEFFSTFGGNPVACAAGLAVLDVMEDERLQERARTGRRPLHRGIEASGRTVTRSSATSAARASFSASSSCATAETLEPAAAEASYIVDRLRDHGVLAGTDGPLHNVIKIRPPLCFSEADADLFVSTLDAILSEDPVRPGGTKTPEKERA